MKKLFLIFLFAACTNESAALESLQAMGLTDIEFHGYGWFDCSRDDETCTEFSATNAQGRRVHGAVGCSLVGCGKNCTVRF